MRCTKCAIVTNVLRFERSETRECLNPHFALLNAGYGIELTKHDPAA
jgi:hypothetical protein